MYEKYKLRYNKKILYNNIKIKIASYLFQAAVAGHV